MISNINGFKVELLKHFKFSKYKNILFFYAMKFLVVINYNKEYVLKFKTNIVNVISMIKTLYFGFNAFQFLIILILYNYIFLVRWYLTFMSINLIIFLKLTIYVWDKRYHIIKSYILFPFYFLINKNMSYINSHKYFFNKKNRIKKYYCFLYAIPEIYNAYISLVTTIDKTNIFLNNVSIDKSPNINKNINFLEKKISKSTIKKCYKVTQYPFLRNHLVNNKKILYRRVVLLLIKENLFFYKYTSVDTISIKSKNLLIFFSLLKFSFKHLLKTCILKLLNFKYYPTIQHPITSKKTQRVFLFFILVDNRIGILIKKYHLCIKFIIFKQHHVAKRLIVTPTNAMIKVINFMKFLIKDSLSFICKLKNKYSFLLQSNNIFVIYLNLYYKHALILENKSKIIIGDKNSIMMLQDYKIKFLSKSFKKFNYLFC